MTDSGGREADTESQQLAFFDALEADPGGRPRAASGAKSRRDGWRVPGADDVVVGVLPEDAPIGRVFHYIVPKKHEQVLPIGTRVRVDLGSRRVGGWVVDIVDGGGDTPLAELASVSGAGPPPAIVDLCRWAADEWVGRWSTMLTTASPTRSIPLVYEDPSSDSAPDVRASVPGDEPNGMHCQRAPHWSDELVEIAMASAVSTIAVPPLEPLTPILVSIATAGPILVVLPTAYRADMARRALTKSGIAAASFDSDWGACRTMTSVGARSSVFAPLSCASAIVVVDEHDERLTEEGSPTWNARDIAIERARRARIPCIFLTATPTVDAAAAGPVLRPARKVERLGWPTIQLIDISDVDPRERRYPPELVQSLRGDSRAAVIGNRLGSARLLACRQCLKIAECESCHASVQQHDKARLSCIRCGSERPVVCTFCGATSFSNLRAGIDRIAEELPALLAEPVEKVTRSTARKDLPQSRILVGTEALLHRLDRVGTVAFLDLDNDLMAPRYRAVEHTLGLLNLAAHCVRRERGSIVIVTRDPLHPALVAVQRSSPADLLEMQAEQRRRFGFPPFGAVALVGGPAGKEFMNRIPESDTLTVLGNSEDSWLIRAADRSTLCSILNAVQRPPGRLKLQVDPISV